MKKLKIYDVKWASDAAGPSPNNNIRTEIFLAGCKKAREGNACRNCFNQTLWKDDIYTALEYPIDVVKQIEKFGSKYVTFVGGEPLDQPEALLETCKLLKEKGYHIIIITHYTINQIINNNLSDLLLVSDIIIDGEYIPELHQFSHDIKDGFTNVIGSGNQVVYDCHKRLGVASSKLNGISLGKEDELVYNLKGRKNATC